MLEKQPFYKKKFFYKDAETFSKISGDFNPIHLSDDFASKSIHGQRIVHGLNIVIWALDKFYKFNNSTKIKSIVVNFKNPVFFRELIFLKINKVTNNSYNFKIFDNEATKVFFSILIYKNQSKKRNLKNKIFTKSYPKKINLKMLNQENIINDVIFNKYLLKREFKNIYKKLDSSVIGTLLKTSNIVGMQVPGEYSTYLSLKGTFDYKNHNLTYRVDNYDTRFNLINLSLSGIFKGRLEALITPKPIKLLPINDIIKLLNKYKFYHKTYFKNKKILIIGGSRGLGAYIVKILSLQDAKVIFTYKNNKKDAYEIIRELKKINKNVETLKFDVLNKNFKMLSNLKPDHVYYMATPRIGKVNNANKVKEEKLKFFYNYYIDGFINLFNFYDNDSKIKFFYPSTTYVNDKNSSLSEYSIIKKQAEKFCKDLNNKESNKKIFIYRIKPLMTDQHLSFYKKVKLDNPLRTLIGIIKKMKDMKI